MVKEGEGLDDDGPEGTDGKPRWLRAAAGLPEDFIERGAAAPLAAAGVRPLSPCAASSGGLAAAALASAGPSSAAEISAKVAAAFKAAALRAQHERCASPCPCCNNIIFFFTGPLFPW